MREDLEQEEQLAALKAYWAKWGNLITSALTAVLFLVAAWNGWNWWQTRQGQQASLVYDKVEEYAQKGDLSALKASAKALREQYSGSIYAAMSALVVANVTHESKDVAGAQESLLWVVEHSSDEGLKHVARLRMANLLMDQGKTDEALKQLDVVEMGGFAALYHDRRGDVYWAAQRDAEARKAYQAALALPDDLKSGVNRQLVQRKLDLLGEE